METLYTNYQRRIKLSGYDDYMNIWFFGDVHRDSPGCDAGRWHYFLKKSKQDDPEKTRYFGMGDYHDFASVSERRLIDTDSMHETTREKFNKIVTDDIDFFTEEIDHMRGRMLGVIEGNHSWKFANGTTATQLLAEKMECPYLGWITHYTLTFDIFSKKQNVYIVACHGRAGGKRIGTSINQVDDLKVIFPAADIYIMGHNHDRGAWPVDVLLPSLGTNGVSIKQKRQFLCRSGSFLKAYELNKSNYTTGRLLRPSDLGALKLKIGFHRDKEDRRLITDIEAVI